MAKKKRWIQSAIGKSRPGALRRRLKIKGEGPIPLKTLRRAASGAMGPVTRQRAQLALTLRKLRRKK